jgi:hypothetical protein
MKYISHTSRIWDIFLPIEEQRRLANELDWRRGVKPGDKASLRILVQNEMKESIFCVTFVSNRSYEAALQEAIGLGQRLLKNEIHAVRVEIRDEHVHFRKPLAVLTRDDIPHIDQGAQTPWMRRILHRILKR